MTSPLHVAIDGYALGDSSSFRGIGTYLRGLLSGLTEVDDVSVTVLATQRSTVPPGLAWKRIRRHAPSRWAMAEHDNRLRLDLSRVRHDVLHSPAQEPPKSSGRPWIQTLHGFLPLLGGADDAELQKWGRMTPRIKSASAWIAVSEQTARHAVDLLELDAGRVHVIPHGVAPEFTTDGPVPDESPYLLFVGEYGPDKGFAEAMAVVAWLASQGFPHRLKMAGRIVPWTEEPIRTAVSAAPRPDLVDLLGYVGHLTQLPALYRGASALIVTSRFESFCLPALEAMASGVPVLAFDNSALPETLGEAGVLIPDGDVAAMGAALARILSSERERERLIESGLERAMARSWKACALRHAEVYRSVVTGS
ncbi:MAG: glycosyltransferase family 4 protein [Mycobacteriales bacterium]